MKIFLRFISSLSFIVGFVLLVADTASGLGEGRFTWLTTADLISRVGGAGALERAQGWVSGAAHPAVWQGLKMTVLAAPAVVVTAMFSLIFWWIGRTKVSTVIPAVREDLR